jgi:hypothetical protein
MSGSYHQGRDATGADRYSTLVAGPSGEWGTPSPPRSSDRQGLPRQPSQLAKPSQSSSQKDAAGNGPHPRNPFRSHHSQTMSHSSGQASSREWASSGKSSPYHAYMQSTAHATPSTSSCIPPPSNPFARSTSGPQPQFKAKSQPFSQGSRSSSGSGPSKAKGVSELISMFDGKPIGNGWVRTGSELLCLIEQGLIIDPSHLSQISKRPLRPPQFPDGLYLLSSESDDCKHTSSCHGSEGGVHVTSSIALPTSILTIVKTGSLCVTDSHIYGGPQTARAASRLRRCTAP